MKQIMVTCDGGVVKIETSGFKGAACLKAVAKLKAALGGEVLSEKRTAEFGAASATEVQNVDEGK